MALNFDNERGRLAEVYAAMSDAELDQLDEHAHSLTQAARLALENELDRRELHLSHPPAAEVDHRLEIRDLTTIRKFRDLPEALLAKGLIESAGIECFLVDHNIVRMDWFISNFVGGVKLQVRRQDEVIALDVLDQPIPAQFDFDGRESFQQPRCPKCKSLDIAFENLNKPMAYASAYLGVPIPVQQNSWKCSTCGRAWRETDA